MFNENLEHFEVLFGKLVHEIVYGGHAQRLHVSFCPNEEKLLFVFVCSAAS